MPLLLLAQLVVTGLLTGAVYALVAVGLSLTFGVMKIINLSHGALYALGGFLAYSLYVNMGIPSFAALPVVMLAAFLLSLLIGVALVTPIREQMLTVMVLTLSVGLLLEQVYLLVWGPFYMSVPHLLPSIKVGGIVVNAQELAAAVVAVAIIISLHAALRTRRGLAVRVVAHDEEIAAVSGVNVARVHMLVFGVGGSLAAAGGALLSPLQVIYPAMGWPPLLISLAIVILGGMGTIKGALAAGIIIGAASSFVSFYAAPEWAYIGSLLLIIAVLLLRPQGVFGKVIRRD